MNNTGLAAKRRGLAVELIGIDGDKTHVRFALESTAKNGFTPDEVTVVNGIAATRDGVALFPKQAIRGVSYALQPVFDATDEQRIEAVQSGKFDELEMVGLDRLIGIGKSIDLLHVDIQGGESDFIRACLETMNAQVNYLVVGTHSRDVEGRIFEDMAAAGWRLEIERPAILSLREDERVVVVDGIQGWRNTMLRPD